MTLAEVGTLVQSLGLIGGLAAILLGGARQTWVWGHQYRKLEVECATREAKLEADRDKWQEMALRNLVVAEGSVEVAKKIGR